MVGRAFNRWRNCVHGRCRREFHRARCQKREGAVAFSVRSERDRFTDDVFGGWEAVRCGAGGVDAVRVWTAVRTSLFAQAFYLAFALFVSAQEGPKRVGIKELQVPMSELKPTATIELGGKPDWTVVTDDAVWVSNSELHAIQRIDPKANKVVAKVD